MPADEGRVTLGVFFPGPVISLSEQTPVARSWFYGVYEVLAMIVGCCEYFDRGCFAWDYVL